MSAYDAIARDLSFGASGWVDEERLVGNVTAKQIIMLCRHVLDQTKHVKKLEAENAALRAQVPKVAKGLRRQWVKTDWGEKLVLLEVAP